MQTDFKRVRVLVVDDHDLFRTGLRALLEDEGFVLADAADGPAGIRRARGFAPHVVVMDVNMPGMTGVQAAPLMLESAPGASILMLAGPGGVLDAVRAGASGCLLKDAELSEIVAAIHAAAAGRSTFSAGVAGHLLLSVRSNDGGPPLRVPSPEERTLSSREREVLTLVSDGCDNAEIAGRLFVSASTVKHHVSKLLEKLGVDNRVQAATFAVREGFSSPVAHAVVYEPPLNHA